MAPEFFASRYTNYCVDWLCERWATGSGWTSLLDYESNLAKSCHFELNFWS